jgi:hypothetical protein
MGGPSRADRVSVHQKRRIPKRQHTKYCSPFSLLFLGPFYDFVSVFPNGFMNGNRHFKKIRKKKKSVSYSLELSLFTAVRPVAYS